MTLDRFLSGSLRLPARLVACSVLLGSLLSACGGDDDKVVIIEGERKSIVELDQEIAVDPGLEGVQIRLPKPYRNPDWPQAGGYANHAMHHLELAAQPRVIWRSSIDGADANRPLVAQPVMGGGMVYAMDADWSITAFDAENGNGNWRGDLQDGQEKRDAATGGGVAYDGGRLYASVGSGFAVALNATTGQQLWRRDFDVALRGAPTVSGGHVYVTTHDNQLYALKADDGEIVWQHVAIAEAAGLIGAASPAVVGDTVIAAFSSGELYALQATTGRIAWADSLTRTGRMTALSTLNDIDGHPVVDRGLVFAVGHSGRMASIDLRSGQRVWENNIASAQTIWVAGDYLYVLTVDNEVLCLSRRNGRIRWVTELQRWKDNKRTKRVIIWTGPILAGNRLIVVSNDGYAMSLSPYTGEVLGAISLPDKKNYISPIVANGTLYLMSDDGRLLALR
ncbi:MAG: PQQ-binding-like beta-propeller repeat protein [Proteobacteria bacterium]|nr:PQQ-binding-like beta-propeller repeat protein [Pseudomonadota bacterium]